MKDLFNLSEKVAIITGGSGVLGSAMALGLARVGVRVAVLGRTVQKVELVVKQIQEEGGTAFPLIADVLQEEQLKTAQDRILTQWDRIDILVNCAGGNRPGATIMPNQTFFDLSINDFDSVTDLNLKGTLLPTLIFGATMAKQKQGVVINISSMAAQKPLTRVLGYAASKAAIDNFTKWMAVEMAQKFGAGIRVNAIAPGFFIGEQNRSLLLNENGSLTSRGKTIIAHTPMRRFGEPEELCGTLNWLCSDAARFVTGVIVPVDGGFSAFGGV